MTCYAIDGVRPVVHPSAYVHPQAVLIGDVIIEAGVYIAPFATLRADFGRIYVQEFANVQDNCVIHGFPKSVTLLEPMAHIGHSSILHGCTVRKNALIGINSTILDDSEIGENSIVGANSFVKARQKLPSDSLILGNPAKVVRSLRPDEIAWKTKGTQEYIQLVKRCKATMQVVEPWTDKACQTASYLDFYAEHRTKS